MGNMQFSVLGNEEEGQNITIFVPGQGFFQAHSTHPNWTKILEGATASDESVVDLFDISKTVGEHFERLSDQITASNGRLFFDGDEIADAAASQILRFLDEGVLDWKPLVKFFEKVRSNPEEHSKVQLYEWLTKHDFTITDEGDILGYKGVRSAGESFKSINSGRAIVDGEIKLGHIPNHIGAIVEMPRSEVVHDPEDGCNTGLHVGTHSYASGFARGALLKVYVNPRDVVSVPTDCDAQKMRVCRYTVVDTIDAPITSAVEFSDGYEEYDDEYDGWGDGEFSDEDDDLQANEPTETEVLVQRLGVRGIQVGDRFEDLDHRRQRVLTITGFENGTVATYHVTDTGLKNKISIDRLLTPYRFKRL